QPLAENAVKHGLAARADGGCVRVAARRSGEWLELSVRDDGVGLDAAGGRVPGAGVGTANTRARLAQLYGAADALAVAPAEGGGTRVMLRLPWHAAPWPGRALEGAAKEMESPPSPGGRRWPGRVAAAVLFLVLWRRAYGVMLGFRVLPDRLVGAT